MSKTNGVPVYTELDEQRFRLWLGRLEDSYKIYQEVSGASESPNKEELLAAIKSTIQSDLEKYPSWISLQKSVPAGKIASSSNDMKTFLRHIAFPHVLQSYDKIISEICPKHGVEACASSSSSAAASSASQVDIESGGASESASAADGSANGERARPAASTLSVPMHTAPICSQPGTVETAVEDFFRGLSKGNGDGLVNLCKLADVNHRINRACDHDSQQVAHWIATERSRGEEYSASLLARQERLQFLRGEDEGRLIESSVGKLKEEINVLNQRLIEAAEEEEAARKIYEAAIQKRRRAGHNIVNLEDYIDNVAMQRDLLQKINDLRVEADQYNISSAQHRVGMFRSLEKYVQSVQDEFVERRLAREMPQLFDNLTQVFTGIISARAGQSAEDAQSGSAEHLSLYCASRVGLETIRIWKQLSLHELQPSLSQSMDDFGAKLSKTLATQKPPAVSDSAAAGVYKASNATVVLFFDHLQHDTPEDHVEAQSRVLTCLKMLTDHLVDDPPHSLMDVDVNDSQGSGGKCNRTMQLLNCNDIMSPPVWCLPLAHSPQYLAQLWRLAEEAHQGDLYVPLEFDTEWISEDPYHTSSDEEGGAARRNRNSPSATGNLMRNVDLDDPWTGAMDEAQREAFTKLLTPQGVDHLVAKVIKRMDARTTARTNRSQKVSVSRSARSDERNMAVPSSNLTAAATPAPAASSHSSSNARVLEAPEPVAVKTAMGPGTLIHNYRRDGIVSVKLEWGAIGYFRKESVEISGSNTGAGDAVNRKAERASYSAAQAFYVSGSAGRFLHNDMELHNIMARLVTLVRVQRIIGDFVAINHANLSLYMHGRTSSGLTKTIEATITRWVEKFDQAKLSDLLDLAEQAVAKGSPIDPQDFIKLLNQCAMPAGQVCAVKKDANPPPAHAAKAERRVSDMHKELAKLADRPSDKPPKLKMVHTASADVPFSSIERQTPVTASATTAAATPVTPAAVKVHKERSKTPTDVRTLARYSKDGETLRELMLAIMRNRKISQGSIANEYYKSFRYETSQGGVSAWFHFRGNSSTFDSMNHCALMWADDQKHHLTAEEQATLAQVNKRMSQEPGQQNHQFAAHHGTASAHSQGVSASDSLPEPANSAEPNTSIEIKSEGSPQAVSSQHQDAPVDGANSVSSDNEMSVDADQESGGEDSDRDDAPPATDHNRITSIAATTANGDVSVHVQEAAPSSATKLANTTFCDFVLGLGSANPLLSGLEATHQATSELVLPAHTPAALNVNTIALETLQPAAVAPAPAADAPLAAPPAVIRTIDDLHSAVVYEMNRRKVSQSRAAVEANLRELGMGQPALSKFLSIASINNNDRGKMFSDYMVKWVSYSRGLPAADGWDPLQAPAYRPPYKPSAGNGAAQEALPARVSSSASVTNSTAGSSNLQVPSVASESSDGGSEGSDDEPKDTEMLTPRVSIKPDVFKPMEKLSHMRHQRGEVGEEEELTCGLCGKLSTEFANNKSFHMHLAWCYRRKNQTRPPPDHMLRTTGAVVGAAPDWPGTANGSKKRRPSGFADDANKRPRVSSVADLPPKPRAEEMSTMKDTYVINADSFKQGYHYDTCEVCKSHGDVIPCASCPCTYHARCADVDEAPVGKWHCPKCRETGAAVGELLSEDAKSDPSIVESWILVYSDGLHRWRKAVVLALHPERRGVVLAKWWRIDNKGGKSNWLNINDAKILTAVPEKVSMANSRTRTQIPSLLAAGSRERSQTVRFDATPDKKSSNARFKESSVMMHMDGETGGAVPPLVSASAAGIGGIGALRDGEFPDEKGINISGNGMSDTYISSNSLKAALCAAGSACRAVDIAICNENTNVFACTRPPGHHAGRYGCTGGCLSTGFCLLNNAAIAAIYGRVRWGLERVAVVDIDVHFGNGTAELLRNDPNAFFASVHMIYGEDNDGLKSDAHKKTSTENPETKTRKTRASASLGFYPARMGLTEVTDTYVSVGVYPTQDSSPRSGARRKKKVVVASDSEASAAEEEEPEAEVEALGSTETAAGLDTAMDTGDGVASADAAAETPRSAADASKPKETKPATSSGNSSGSNGKSGGGCTSEAQKRAYVGSDGFLAALRDVILPQMEKFRPQLLVISAGFDGYISDPLGGQLCLSLEDYQVATKMLMASMQRIQESETNPNLITGKVISLLEGGYDTSPFTLGLAKCVDAHVIALQEG